MTKQISIQMSEKEERPKELDNKWAVRTMHSGSDNKQDALDDNKSNEILYQNLAYAMLIPILSMLLSAGFTIFPQHNVFQQPGYWYEAAIPINTGLVPSVVFLTVLRMRVFFEEIKIKTSAWIKLYLANSINVCFIVFITHFLWTDYLGYAYPVPWLYILIPMMLFPFLLFTIILLFPREYREDLEKRKTIKWFIVYKVAFFTACFERLFVILAFLSTPLEVQPLWAIALPMWREFDLWMLTKLVKITAGVDNRNAKIFTCLENQCNHSAVTAISLGLYATDFSCYCILFTDLFYKLYSCYGICKLKKKIEAKEGSERKQLQIEKEEATQDLILDEMVEVTMPIVYALMVVLAYFGPNATILGNVGCEIWKWRKIDSLTKFLTALFRMFSIDLLALVLNSLLLLKYSSVNVMKQLCIDVKIYWPFISVAMGGAVIKVLVYFLAIYIKMDVIKTMINLTIGFSVFRILVLLSDGHQLGLGYESGIQLGGIWDKSRVKK